jgi:uncharacterized membrane protein YqaE (UPF0057 family)
MSGSVSVDPVLAEQTKLTATLLNTVAAGCVVAGIITPLVGVALGALQITFDMRLTVVFCALLYVSGTLHWTARRILRRLGS